MQVTNDRSIGLACVMYGWVLFNREISNLFGWMVILGGDCVAKALNGVWHE